MSHPLPDFMNLALGKVREMVDANTVVGELITTPDGVTIIPVSSIKVGVGGGGADYATKHNTPENPFGGGIGAGVTVTPVAFLIVKEGSVRMLPVTEGGENPVDRLLELLPDLIKKLNAFLSERKKKKKDAEAADDAEEALAQALETVQEAVEEA